MNGQDSEKSSQKPSSFLLAISVLASAAIVSLSWTHFYEDLESSIYDFRFRLRNEIFGLPVQLPDVATLDIDDLALQTYGWPFTRDRHAALVNVLHKYNARMIGFDIFFYEPSTRILSPDQVFQLEKETYTKKDLLNLIKDHDQDFRRAAKKSDIVYLAQTFEITEKGPEFARINLRKRSAEKDAALQNLMPFSVPLSKETEQGFYHAVDVEIPLKDFVEASKGVGFALPKPDHDGIVRHYRMGLIYDGRIYFSLSLIMACDFLQVPLQKVRFLPGKYVELPDAHLPSGSVSNVKVPINDQCEMLVNWAGPYHSTYRHLPYNLVLDFAATDPINRALKATKRVFHSTPEALDNESLFLQKAREAGGTDLKESLLLEMLNRVSLSQFMEKNLKDNPDLTLKSFANDLGIGQEEFDEVAEGWSAPFEEIKINLRILKTLQTNPDLSLQQIGEEIGVSRLENIKYGVGVLRDLIRQGGIKPEDHPLIFEDLITSAGLHGEQSADRIVSADAFQNTLFFYGLTATGTHDLNPTPFGAREAMLGAHVNVFNTILTQNFLKRIPKWGNAAIMLLLGTLIGFLVPKFRALSGACIILIILSLYMIAAFLIFAQAGIWIDALGPIATLIIGYLSITLYNYVQKEKEKEFVQGAFGHYLDPNVVSQLVENPNLVNQLGGDQREMTVFFSDVASFSTISENLTPVELVELLNEYLSEMCDIIAKHNGTIDKFEGDAVMAFWGAPLIQEDHARRAVIASVDMQQKLLNLRQQWEAEGKMDGLRKLWSEQNRGEFFRVRMGINTGEMVVGNMGSRTRVDYTIMGDAVNLASRLEGAGKAYGVSTMISENTFLAAQDFIVVRELDSIRVVGKDEPVGVYELLGRRGEVDPKLEKVVNFYAQGLDQYRQQKWDKAILLFESGLKLDPEDGPSQIFIDRCKNYKNTPPQSDWNAVHNLDEK